LTIRTDEPNVNVSWQGRQAGSAGSALTTIYSIKKPGKSK